MASELEDQPREEMAYLNELDRWLQLLTITGNTWALVGHNISTNTSDQWCTWPQAVDYVKGTSEEVRHLWRLFGPETSTDQAIKVEEAVRAEAIQLTRGREHVPWGAALVQAHKVNRYRWQEVMRTYPAAVVATI